jgi:hypothetical protein
VPPMPIGRASSGLTRPRIFVFGMLVLSMFEAGMFEAGLTGLATVAFSTGAAAQGNAAPPLPPQRPATLTLGPQLPQPKPLVPAGVDPMVADFAPDMPETLPPASRAQMHKCGSEWQKMKASGAAADKTWLSFAKICLTR